ncbi:putative GMC oxidoreductase [Daldinia decipiens]|uniref:putative GMC oxidoreductase n=1 Tax=Daldinia decipiens TaxID=326647 RepID=UPI0020C441F3|nr:putative GMC oxidoreductase [Daldinia decipiens]KAI1660241.1 putative GMC oxidoreductase [Daldinia decipiens]
MNSESYDFIIAGGGTAALVVAARLSEDSSQRILVLEAGSDHSEDPRVKIPALYAALKKSEVDWDFQTETQSGLNNRRIDLNQGKALGGSSVINAEVFAPPTKKLIDSWALLGNDGWTWEGLRDYYAKAYTSPPRVSDNIKKSLGVDGWTAKNESGTGPVHVSFPGNLSHPIREAWAKTFKDIGYLMPNDPWVDPSVGVGSFSNLTSIDPVTRERNHSAKAYYYPVKSRKNLHVLTNAVVEKIIFGENSTKATGVQYRYEAQTRTASARKEVIVAAGALQSPKLLELSGIGNASLLERHDIKVVRHLEGVGENLQDHLVCDVDFEAVDDLETLDVLRDPGVMGQSMQEFMTNHTGLLTTNGVITYAYMPVVKYQSGKGREFLEQMLDKNRPTPESFSGKNQAQASAYYNIAKSTLLDPNASSVAYLTALSNNNISPDPATGKPAPPAPGKYIIFAATLAQPLSRGSVHIKSNDISDAPIVDPRYLTNQVDVEIFAEHMHYIHTLAASPSLNGIFKQPLKISPSAARFADLDAAKEYLRARASSMWHPAGTCAMLPEEIGGVVDSNLKVYGVENLRVVDSSIVPLLPPGNLQSTVYALAEKAADLIKLEYGLKTTN